MTGMLNILNCLIGDTILPSKVKKFIFKIYNFVFKLSKCKKNRKFPSIIFDILITLKIICGHMKEEIYAVNTIFMKSLFVYKFQPLRTRP